MARAAAGDFRAAKRDFVRSLELNPNDSAARNNLTLVLIHLGDFADAVPHIERLIVEQPENASHRARLAWCQWKLGKRDAAIATLAEAEVLAPNDPVVRQVAGMIREAEPANKPRQ
jgi:Flp pilus assembly protein TadD